VAGLNNSDVLTGTLTANFGGNHKLVGTLSGGSIASLHIHAKINNNGSFSGSATANNVFGYTNGHFFGANAASLAGVAEFASNASLNTAFGGTKNP